jgi:hypothetical protein
MGFLKIAVRESSRLSTATFTEADKIPGAFAKDGQTLPLMLNYFNSANA